jgi:hypothetical protein
VVHWAEEFPTLRAFPKVIEADCFNRVRLALLRIENPLRLDLPGIRGAACILDDRAWVCVDVADDQPLMAWLKFRKQSRALHQPVPCELRLFHMQAGLLMGPALEALDRSVGDLLQRVKRPPR